MENMWEAIIGNPALDETDKATSDILKDLEQRQKEIEYPVDAEISSRMLKMLNSDITTARDLIAESCKFLSCYPRFLSGETALLSIPMLVEGKGSSPNQTCQVLINILLPNLYSILLLEADIRQQDMKEPMTFSDFVLNKDTQSIDFSSMYRTLASSAFSPELKKLLGVQSRAGKEQYQIRTNFPNLLLGLTKYLNISPLSENVKTANSYIYNIKFYKGCFSQIAPKGLWTEKSFEEYYILERIFRIETKLHLFDILKKESIEKSSDISFSHKLLSDFFFSSPLAILPKTLYSTLLKNGYDRIRSEDEKICIPQSLHFLIQLSAVWFPSILRIMRTYMVLHDVRKYQDVKDFLFSGPDYFKSFSDTHMPMTDKRNTKLDTRALKEEYSNEWSDFTPLGGYCSESMEWSSLQSWATRRCPDSYSLAEQYALKQIQDTLQFTE